MKKLVFLTIALFSLTSTFAIANNLAPANEEYLVSVREDVTPVEILEVQTMVSEYDVTKAQGFEGRNEPFKAVFRLNKGTISAEYDQNGELISSNEDFSNVRLPVQVRNEVFNQYGEGWEIVKNRYSVSYERGQDAEIFYTIKLRNGNKTERIMVDADLNITKA